MNSFLRGRHGDDDEAAAAPRPDVNAVLPASVRPPDVHRFEEADETDDADLEFLTALATEVDRTASPAGPQAKAPLRGANPRIDDMQVFREMKDEGNKAFRYDHRVQDVEMGDLLEELNTVRAALRRQKAA